VNSERWGEISVLINEFLMRGIHCCNTDVVDC
jgi:hypothetical protein